MLLGEDHQLAGFIHDVLELVSNDLVELTHGILGDSQIWLDSLEHSEQVGRESMVVSDSDILLQLLAALLAFAILVVDSIHLHRLLSALLGLLELLFIGGRLLSSYIKDSDSTANLYLSSWLDLRNWGLPLWLWRWCS